MEERKHVREAPCSTSDPAVINHALRRGEAERKSHKQRRERREAGKAGKEM